jgi:hypothetical protein
MGAAAISTTSDWIGTYSKVLMWLDLQLYYFSSLYEKRQDNCHEPLSLKVYACFETVGAQRQIKELL